MPSWAPRPATSDGSIAATVTRGGRGLLATPVDDIARAIAGASRRAASLGLRTAADRRGVRLRDLEKAIGGPPLDIGKPRYDPEEATTCWNCDAAWSMSFWGAALAEVTTACLTGSSAAYIVCVCL